MCSKIDEKFSFYVEFRMCSLSWCISRRSVLLQSFQLPILCSQGQGLQWSEKVRLYSIKCLTMYKGHAALMCHSPRPLRTIHMNNLCTISWILKVLKILSTVLNVVIATSMINLKAKIRGKCIKMLNCMSLHISWLLQRQRGQYMVWLKDNVVFTYIWNSALLCSVLTKNFKNLLSPFSTKDL